MSSPKSVNIYSEVVPSPFPPYPVALHALSLARIGVEGGGGVEVFCKVDAELFPEGCELADVLVVLAFVFDFGFDGCGFGGGWLAGLEFGR